LIPTWKAGLSPQETQDVVQETVLAATRNIGTFRYDPAACACKTWLLHVTRSRILNQYRRKNRDRAVQAPTDESDATPLIERVADPAARLHVHGLCRRWRDGGQELVRGNPCMLRSAALALGSESAANRCPTMGRSCAASRQNAPPLVLEEQAGPLFDLLSPSRTAP